LKRFKDYNVKGYRAKLISFILIFGGCNSLPTIHHEKYSFPKGQAFIGDVKRPYEVLGRVRSKHDFPTLDQDHEESDLCKNYYNKAVADLIKFAHDKGGEAVIDVKSVVFLENGKQELYTAPECSDDGMEGQILTQGIAVKWKPIPPEGASPAK
jgi:hypothetical protein